MQKGAHQVAELQLLVHSACSNMDSGWLALTCSRSAMVGRQNGISCDELGTASITKSRGLIDD